MAQVPSYASTNGLVGYWSFNGNANDTSRNANNGIVLGATLTADRFGKPNGAYLFNRNIVSSITLPLKNNIISTFSVLIWVKPTTTVNVQTESTVCPGSISVKMANSNQNWAIMPYQLPDPNIGAGGLSIGTNGYMTAKHGLNILEAIQQKSGSFSGYNCIVQVFQNNTLFVYENGILVSTKSFGCPGNVILGSTLNVGGYLWSPNFSGEVDEVGIWNRALTQSEITNLYNSKQENSICETIGQDSNLLYTNGYVVGPENKNCDKGIHLESKWVDTPNVKLIEFETFQHRTYDYSKVYDQDNNLIYQWNGISESATWYTKQHTLNISGNSKIKIEFYQGFDKLSADIKFCNGYMKITKMNCSSQPLGIDTEDNKNLFTIYPNLAKNHITIDSGNLANVTGYQIKIFNELGQAVFTGAINTQRYTVPLNTWSGKGVYLVKIYDAVNNVVNTKKIILQ